MAELRLRRLADLVWYLTEGVPAFERSSMAGQLQRAEEEAHQTTCPVCNGMGTYTEAWLERSMRKYRERNPGKPRAWEVREADKRRKLGRKCKRCKGKGMLAAPIPLVSALPPPTAQPKQKPHSAGEDSRDTVPDATVLRFARVSRWLGQLPLSERDALCAAYMQEACREGMFAAERETDRLWAVVPLTAVGQQYAQALRSAGAEAFQDECRRRLRALRPTPLADQARVLNDWSALCESEDEKALPLVQVVPDPLPAVEGWSWQEIRAYVADPTLRDISDHMLGAAAELLTAAEARWAAVVGPQVAARVRKPLLGSVGHLAAWIRTAAPRKRWSQQAVKQALAACGLLRGSAYDVRDFAKAMPELAEAYFAAFRVWPKPGRWSVIKGHSV